MVLSAISKFATKIFGSRNERLVKRYMEIAHQITALEPRFREFSDEQFKTFSDELRKRLADGEDVRRVLPEAFANLREAMDRFVGIRSIFRQQVDFEAAAHGFDPRVGVLTNSTYDLSGLKPEFAEMYGQAKARIAAGESLAAIVLPATFYEEIRRLYPSSSPGTPRARLFDVQMVGGQVLFDHNIAEMSTGEGKTLAAPLAAYLNCLQGFRTHIVTVNDYLVQRDRNWMAPAYEGLGLTVGAIQSQMENADRHKQYGCDITYGTNNEFGFDYLRDNMKLSIPDQVQGPLDFAIIDEVDSILIDEARTPLIISGPAADDTSRYGAADGVARKLIQFNRDYDRVEAQVNGLKRTIKQCEGDLASGRESDDKTGEGIKSRLANAVAALPEAEAQLAATRQYYEVELDKHSAHLTHEGIAAAQAEAGVGSFYVGANMEWPHLLEQALRAHVVYQRDKDYVVQEGEVIIVDEFTGRLMIGRQWSDGLHQAVEAKERVRVKEETQTLATITIQNFFKLYKKLAGMTGTAMTEAEEFYKIYKLDVVAMPTNRPCIRDDTNDRIYGTTEEKYDAIVEEIREVSQAGRPVLVGTTSIEKSEHLSSLLTKRFGIEHEVLNARQHAREAEIIVKAGETHTVKRGKEAKVVGNVTIATNMAGRGTDIKLGPGVAEAGGLHVVGTERHEARRIDNQLRGRGGRQGDPGSSRFFLSLRDDLLAVFAGEWTLKVLSWLGLKEGAAIEDKRINKGIERAQKKVEEKNFLIRKRLLEYDEVMDTQRKIFYQQRQDLLRGREIAELIWKLINDSIDDAVTDLLDVDYRGRCIAQWARSAFDVGLDPKDLRDAQFEDIVERLRRRAKDEAQQNIAVTIGEYMEDEGDSKTWDTHGLGSWAMSRFGVNLSATQLRKMTPEEVETHLVEAAWVKLDTFDFAPILPYLEPDYPALQVADWADKKFGLRIDPAAFKGLEAADACEKVREAVRDLYRRREVEYPVQFALRASVGQTSTDDPYAADQLLRWANFKYRLNWSLADVQGKPFEDLEATLLERARAYRNGALAAEIEQALGQAGTQGEQVAAWAKERFGAELSADELANDAKGALVAAGRSFFRRELTDLERYLLVDIFDVVWKDHLYAMDHLKDSIGLRGFAERDPLIEYKREGFRMFQEMLRTVRDRVTDVITKVQLSAPARSRYNISETRHDEFADGSTGVHASNEADRAAADQAGREGKKVQQIVNTGPAVGPNDPCPCGSGKKYKKCCGRVAAKK